MRQCNVEEMFWFNLLDACALLSEGSLEGNHRKNSKRQQCEMLPRDSERKTQTKPIKKCSKITQRPQFYFLILEGIVAGRFSWDSCKPRVWAISTAGLFRASLWLKACHSFPLQQVAGPGALWSNFLIQCSPLVAGLTRHEPGTLKTYLSHVTSIHTGSCIQSRT